MAVGVTLTVSPSAPVKGQTVTATYAVSGNVGTAATVQTVSGSVTVGSQVLPVTTTVTIPGTPAQPETFAVPTCTGLTFVATANPKVFTAVVP